MEWLLDPTLWIGLVTLVLLEIVLGIDNLIFIAILAGKLPSRERDKARLIGLALALVMRLALISVLSWLVTLTRPIVTFYAFTFSGRDLILLFGGLFLLYKATTELHERLEGKIHPEERSRVFAGFWVVVAQIVVLDAVFSLDSVILAIGMVDHLYMMMIAITIAMGIMMLASRPLTLFVNSHPTIVILCLSFLLMVGFSLITESIGFKIPKEYIYAAIGFSVVIEFLNQIAQRNFTRNVAMVPLRERTAEAVLRMLGSRPRSEMDMEDEDEESDTKPQAFGVEERNMVSGVLTLGERTIRSIMTPRNEVSWINLEDDIGTIQNTLRTIPHSHFPVCREQLDNLVGIGRAKDLLDDILSSGKINEETSLRSPIVLLESAGVLHAMNILKQSHGQLVLVADEYGTIQGVMTPIDILEAIAGEFPDEDEQPEVEQTGPDSWKINGTADLYYLEQVLETDAMIDSNSEYSSLAGFLLERFGTVPEVGQSIEWNDLRFEVAEMEDRRIAQVLVNRISSKTEEEDR